MAEQKRPLKVFLCHASADKPKVRELYRYLRRRGIKPWFDEVDLVPGQDWQVEIPQALSTSDATLICLTKNSVDKEGYVQSEIKFALEKALEMPAGRIFLIPVRLEECEVPLTLRRYQWVDLFEEGGYAKMMRALKARASQLLRREIELPDKAIREENLPFDDGEVENAERRPGQFVLPQGMGSRVTPWMRIAAVLGIVLALLWIGFRTLPNLFPSIPTGTATLSTQALKPESLRACDEAGKIADTPISVRFRRWQGVSQFAVENAPEHAIFSNMVRAMTIDQRGLWLGYFPMQGNQSAGLGFFDKANWYDCNTPEGVNGENVNDIAIDQQGRIWVTLEGVGVALYDGEKWTRFTRSDGLASKDVFRITIDANNVVWVGTWEGVAKYDGRSWSTPYSAENGTLQNNHVAAILFDPQGNIWLGHHERGISLYNNSEGKWEFIEAGEGSLGGNKVRALALQAADANGPESIWVATADGGLSRYSNGIWTQYHEQAGLPSEDVKDVKIDPLNRVWVATADGVVYLENDRWVVYDTYDTARIAFGVACPDATCPYDQDHILTATSGSGFTHSRLPKPNMLDVPEACFVIDNEERTCVSPTPADAPNTMEAALPTPVSPGQKIRFEIIVSPRSPYQLREDRGDLLSFAEESDANLFGAYTQIAVKGTVDSGQKYTFTDYDNPIVVPQAQAGQEFTSTWRVWLHTRYAGQVIELSFMVAEPK